MSRVEGGYLLTVHCRNYPACDETLTAFAPTSARARTALNRDADELGWAHVGDREPDTYTCPTCFARELDTGQAWEGAEMQSGEGAGDDRPV